MKKNTIVTLVVVLVALFVVVGGGTLAYNVLSERVPADSALVPMAEQPDMGEDPPPAAQGGAPDAEEIAEAEDPTPDEQEDAEREVFAPDFTVEDAYGNEVRLSDMRGRPVVINFWASWCPPCVAEMPDFNRVYEDLGDEVKFMMVCLVDGASETRESGAAFVAENGFTFPVYYDMTREAATAYEIRSIPTTYFINTQGRIEARAQGMIDEETLRMGIAYIWG